MPEETPTLSQGRYRLLEILGEGGMAVVYRAWDGRLRVDRAIKLLSPAVARQADLRARFENEARTMAGLRHENIVAVHDIGQDGDEVFMVMELVEGGTLWDWVVGFGQMPPRMALQATLPVLDAMAVAHEAGIIHRDIKPQNIMLTEKGLPKVADFGIAHMQDPLADRNLTRTGTIMGTWGYMAPEQRQSSRKVDARSDIYALGAMLYAVGTGKIPVDLFASDEDDELLEGLQPALADIIHRATRYKPERRFADVAEMGQAVERALEELPPIPEDRPPLGPLPERPADDAPATVSMVAPWRRGTVGETSSFSGAAPGKSSQTFDMGLDDLPEAGESAAQDPPKSGSAPSDTILPPDTALEERSRRLAARGLLLAAGLVALAAGGAWLAWAPRSGPDEAEPATVAYSAPERGAELRNEPEGAAGAGEVAEEAVAGGEPGEGEAPDEEVAVASAEDEPLAVRHENVGAAPAAETAVPKASEPEEPAPPPAPAEQEAAQEAASTPVVEEPAPPPVATGRVRVTGDAERVQLADSGGTRHAPGSLPAGSYVIWAWFPGREDPVAAGKVTVEAGGEKTINCGAVFQKCG